MKILFLIAAALILANCSHKTEIAKAQEQTVVEQKQETAQVADKPAAAKTQSESEYKIPEIKLTKGVLVLNDERPNEKGFIRFYNRDGSLWYKFTFFYDDGDGDFEYRNDNFLPTAFHPDYFLLVLTYAGEDAARYKVIVNEETHLTKYVKKSDKTFKFEPWEKHVLTASTLDFDKKTNPPRDTPGGKIKPADLSDVDRFETIEIRGEWIKIEWNAELNPDNTVKRTESGWIRWKKNGKLIIELGYLC